MTEQSTAGLRLDEPSGPPRRRTIRDIIPRQRPAAEPTADKPTADEPPTPPSRSRLTGWWWPALVMLALGLWDVARPGAWTDEMATWGAVRLTISQLQALDRHIDGVIGPYYAALHFWTVVFGTSDVSLRVPSVLALTGACGLLAILGARIASPRAGVLAGLLLALTPAMSRFAQEERMYAFAVLGAVLSTLLLHRAIERPSWLRFSLYAGSVVLLGCAHLVALLIVLAHFVAALVAGRTVLFRWVTACAAAALPLSRLVHIALLQRDQVAWIPPLGWRDTPALFAEVFGGAVVGTILVVLTMLARVPARAAALIVAWGVLPPVALGVLSLYRPLLIPRYLLFVVPACALLAGVALARLPVVRVVAVVAVFALAGLSEQLAIRGVAGHSQDTKGAAAVIAERERPGDAVAYSPGDPWGSWVTRDLVARYVPSERRPHDVFQVRPPRINDGLWGAECADPVPCLGDAPRVWVVRNGYHQDPLEAMSPASKEQLLRQRYHVDTVVYPAGMTVALLVAGH